VLDEKASNGRFLEQAFEKWLGLVGKYVEPASHERELLRTSFEAGWISYRAMLLNQPIGLA
jgi:hypothetical protein